MKKNILVVISVIVITAVLSACSFFGGKAPSDSSPQTGSESTGESSNEGPEDGSKVMMNLYFANEDNSAVPIEKREVTVENDEVIKAAIEALLQGPRDASLRRTIPEGTKLLSVNLKDKVAIVDFSKEFTNVNGIAEIVERASLVNTLTEIDGVEKVKVLVEGKDLIGPSGFPFGEMIRFKLDEKGYPMVSETKTITLYFANAEAELVEAEKREVTVNQGEPLEAVVFRELLNGPKTEGLYGVMPEGTKLLSVETKDGICYLNLSQEFVDNSIGGSAGELVTINSIVSSLTEIPGVEKVQFLINGEIREAYIQMVFDEPIPRNEKMIKK